MPEQALFGGQTGPGALAKKCQSPVCGGPPLEGVFLAHDSALLMGAYAWKRTGSRRNSSPRPHREQASRWAGPQFCRTALPVRIHNRNFSPQDLRAMVARVGPWSYLQKLPEMLPDAAGDASRVYVCRHSGGSCACLGSWTADEQPTDPTGHTDSTVPADCSHEGDSTNSLRADLRAMLRRWAR